MTKPKTPAISVRGETYKRLREEANRQDITIANLVERVITKALDDSATASSKQVRAQEFRDRYDSTPPTIKPLDQALREYDEDGAL